MEYCGRRQLQSEPYKARATITMPNLAQRLAHYAHNLRFEDLPAQTVHEVKRRFIDTLGCAMGAIPGDPCRIARTMAKSISCTEPATVIGTSHKSSPEM